MHENALFCWKIAKIAQRWGLHSQTPLTPTAGDSAPRPSPTPPPDSDPGFSRKFKSETEKFSRTPESLHSGFVPIFSDYWLAEIGKTRSRSIALFCRI